MSSRNLLPGAAKSSATAKVFLGCHGGRGVLSGAVVLEDERTWCERELTPHHLAEVGFSLIVLPSEFPFASVCATTLLPAQKLQLELKL